jgi:hypothetical protein
MRRAFLVWLLLMFAESIHGTLRKLLLAARRRGVVVESFAQQLAAMPNVGRDEDFARSQQDERAPGFD